MHTLHRTASILLTAIILSACVQDEAREPAPDTTQVAAEAMRSEGADSTSLSPAARQFVGNQDNLHFILALPDMRMAAYEEATPYWDSGVTAQMHQGNEIVIDFLKASWLRLAAFYGEVPPDGMNEEPIDDYIAARAEQHDAALRADGIGGSMLGVMVGGEVIADLEARIAEMVADVAAVSDVFEMMAIPDYDYAAWQKDWQREVGAEPGV